MFSGFCGKVLAAGLVFVFVHDAMADGLFDPGKKFTIYKGGALLGDPAIFVSVGSGRYGGTFVSTTLAPPKGLQVIAGLVEPQQGGQPGGGHSLVLTPDQTQVLIGYLRKAAEWADVAAQNSVGDYSKTVGYVQGNASANAAVSVVFVSFSDNSSAVQIEQMIAGRAKKFRFKIPQGLKFAEQLQHFLNVALAETTPTPSGGDTSKDKLFK